MNRITPGQVVEAFKRIGLMPAQDEFLTLGKGDEPTACCGLSSLMIDRGAPYIDLYGQSVAYGCGLAAASLGLDRDYAIGFANGWDGDPFYRDNYTPGDHLAYEQGIRDGQAAWDAVADMN